MYRRLVMTVGAAVLVACAARALLKPYDGDFKLHWETGRRFLTGEFIYAGGHDLPYPPFFAMIFAPAALLPIPLAKAVLYPLSVAALMLIFWILRRLIQPAFGLSDSQTFWATALSAVLVIQFAIRDQAELGLNTMILALTWLGIYLWNAKRDFLAGISLGTAIALKCAPAVFLGYFLWKRQWRVALYAAAATALFSVSPALLEGPRLWSDQARAWARNVAQAVQGNGFEQAENFRDRNLALRPVLMRYLSRPGASNIEPSAALPPVNLLNLSPPFVSTIVNTIAIVGVALFMWWSRSPVKRRDEPRLLWELAGAGILMLLLSPITWMQSCVAVLPACFLISALLVRGERLPGWASALLCAYAVFCSLLGRDLVGRAAWIVIASHHVVTFCLAGLLAVVLAGPELPTTRTEREKHPSHGG